MSWYRTGTVNVTNGLTAVTGVGTSWSSVVQPGDAFVGPDGRIYETLTVPGDLSMTLSTPYLGTTASGQSYSSYPTMSRVRELVVAAQALISDFNAPALDPATLPLSGSEVLMLYQGGLSRRATLSSLVQPSLLVGKLTTKAISAPPASLGNHDSILTAFSGDYSSVVNPIAFYITGPSTLGNPPVNYLYRPEAYPHYTYLFNSSGHNEALDGNEGRTAAVAYRVKLDQYGQGDMVAYNFSAIVTTAKAGATSFLANPAASGFNGDMVAAVAGAYLNPYEVMLRDGGFDVAAVGSVQNMDRTNGTGALGCFWAGYRSQSIGSVDVDQALGVVGKHFIGIDLGPAVISGSAMAMRANVKIHLNSTSADSFVTDSLGSEWMTWASATSEFQFVGSSTPQFAVGRVASSVNYMQARGAPSGGLPGLYATGADTNVSAGYRSKGTGAHIFYSEGGATRIAQMGAGWFGLPAGVNAPGAQAGLAVTYIDVSDGHYKIVFPNGVVKTIATNV